MSTSHQSKISGKTCSTRTVSFCFPEESKFLYIPSDTKTPNAERQDTRGKVGHEGTKNNVRYVPCTA